MKYLLLSLALLTGCASQLQIASGALSSGLVSLRAAEDLRLETSRQSFCSMTVDTLNRHPEAVAGVKDLCWSNTTTTANDAAQEILVPKK